MSRPSHKRPRADGASTPPLPATASATPVLCPSCHEHFRAPPHECAPHRLPCAHNVCLACMDTLVMSDELGCPICSKPVEPHVVNLGLAAFAEDSTDSSASPACATMEDNTAATASSAKASSTLEPPLTDTSVAKKYKTVLSAATLASLASRKVKSIASAQRRLSTKTLRAKQIRVSNALYV